MKLFKIDEAIKAVEEKLNKTQSELEFTFEQKSIAYTIVASKPSYTLQGLENNRLLIDGLKRNMLRNLFGESFNMTILEDFLAASLMYKSMNEEKEHEFGKYVFQTHYSGETDVADYVEKYDTYIVCDFLDEDEDDGLVVFKIVPNFWIFGIVKVGDWKERFPELLNEVKKMNAEN